MKDLLRRILPLAAALLVLSISGCSLFDSDDDDDGDDLPRGLVVANGGNFGDQNGSLTVYDAETEQVRQLGDLGAFAHGLLIDGDLAYVALNTFADGRIDVVNLGSGSVVRQLGAPTPRSMAFSDDNTLVVTNLSAFGASGPEPGIVSIINATSGEPSADDGTADLYPEGVAVYGGLAYVANTGSLGSGSTVTVIDPDDGSTVRTLDTGCDGPNEIWVDEDDEVVVVCEGKVVYNDDFTQIIEQTNGQVVFLDPTSGDVNTRIQLDDQAISASQSQNAYFDPESGEIYALAGSGEEVYRIDTGSNSLSATIDVPAQTDLTGLAAVAYDDGSERLYLARLAVGPDGFQDFTSSGAVIILDRSGDLLGRFEVGPGPTHIEFAD